jgi:nitrate/TMAO reductase-like tetraheme cytochrome c subunit
MDYWILLEIISRIWGRWVFSVASPPKKPTSSFFEIASSYLHGEIILKPSRRIGLASILGLAFLTIFLTTYQAVTAQTPTEPPLPTESPGGASGQPGVSNDYCLSCHAAPDMQTTLPSGEVLYLTVDPEIYRNTVHGLQGYACVQCHTDIREFPHPPLKAETRRDVTLLYYQTCARCHQAMYEKTLDSVHQQALDEGNKNAAVCTDCHGAHNVLPPGEPRTRIPSTCRNCHSTIYETYTESVHGEALIGEGNQDVPTCIDCHGVHNVSGPSNRPFHLFSPQICARCHADKELMDKYGISTNVFNSYVADFHGTTVIFDQSFPDQEMNKPVCIDCHGVHNMKQVDEQESQVMKENLIDTCRKCHPDASANFTDAWLSHYQPDRNHYPAVYYTNLFYKFFIPAVLGGMAIFVVGDASRRILNRRRKKNHE